MCRALTYEISGRFTVAGPSHVRAVVVPVADVRGNTVLTELTLHSLAPQSANEASDGDAIQVEQVARGEFISARSYSRDKFDRASSRSSGRGGTEGVSLGSQQVLVRV